MLWAMGQGCEKHPLRHSPYLRAFFHDPDRGHSYLYYLYPSLRVDARSWPISSQTWGPARHLEMLTEQQSLESSLAVYQVAQQS